MSLTSSTRLLPWGRGLIPLELPFAAKFSSFKRTLLEMDDLSRFQYAVAASVVLHAIVLFGVTFRPHDLSRLDSASPALEVVLVNSRSKTRPVRADAVAQHNLDGGGNTDEKRRAQSPLPVLPDQKTDAEVKLALRRVEQLYLTNQQVRDVLAEAVPRVVRPHRQRVGEHQGPRVRREGRLEHHRPVEVAARHAAASRSRPDETSCTRSTKSSKSRRNCSRANPAPKRSQTASVGRGLVNSRRRMSSSADR